MTELEKSGRFFDDECSGDTGPTTDRHQAMLMVDADASGVVHFWHEGTVHLREGFEEEEEEEG